MFGFESGNVRDGSEDIGAVGSRSFDAVSIRQLISKAVGAVSLPVVDTPFASLVVDIKVLEVVVEIYTTSTQVSSEQSSVGGKDGSYVDMPLSAESNSETSLPFVEMGNDSSLGFSACELGVRSCVRGRERRRTSPRNHATMYPKTIASLVSWSLGGEGIPARFQRSVFHSFILLVSSNHWKVEE